MPQAQSEGRPEHVGVHPPSPRARVVEPLGTPLPLPLPHQRLELVHRYPRRLLWVVAPSAAKHHWLRIQCTRWPGRPC